MADVKIDCPYCNQRLEIPEELVGQDFNCPACNEVIELAEVEAPPEPAASPRKTQLSLDGGINRPCPKCRLPVHRALSRCRHCGASMEASNEPCRYGGIGRPLYILGFWGLGLLIAGILAAAWLMPARWLALLAPPLALAIPVILTLLRLKNLGMKWWWLLLACLPGVNLYVGFLCFVCPEGYHANHRLDRAGKILIGVLILSLLAPVVPLFWVGPALVAELRKSLAGDEPAPSAVDALPEEAPATEVVTRFKGLTVENWETAIESSFLSHPGWFGSVQHKGATLGVAALNENSPAGGFWGAITRRFAPTVVILVTPPAEGGPLTIDTSEVRYKYATGSNKLFPPAIPTLQASPVNPNGLVSRYVGARTLPAGAEPYVSVVFAGPAFDWSVIVAVSLNVDGQEIVIPGRICTVEDKVRLNSIGRGLRDTREK